MPIQDNDGIAIEKGYYVLQRGTAYYHVRMNNGGKPEFSTDGRKYFPLTSRYAKGLTRLDHPEKLVELVQTVEKETKSRALETCGGFKK